MVNVSLTNIKDFLKKYAVWLGVVALLILILVIILSFRTKGQPARQLPKIEVDQSILFQGRSPVVVSKIPQSVSSTLPREGKVFKLQPFPTKEAVATIAAGLSALTDRGQNQDGEFVFTGENSLLFYSQNNSTLRFSQKSIRKPVEQPVLTEDELINKAKGFVLGLGLYKTDDNAVLQSKGFTVLSGLEFTTVENFLEADFLDLGLTKLLNGAPIYAQTPTLAPTQIKIAKTGEVVLLDHIFIEIQGSNQYNLKTPEALIKSLQQADAFAVRISEKGKRVIELSSPYKLRTAEATNAALVYFKDNSTSNPLQPVFRLDGTAKTEAGGLVELVLIVPAVNSK